MSYKLCITFLNILPLVFFSLNVKNVEECCKAQSVYADQRMVLYKSDLLSLQGTIRSQRMQTYTCAFFLHFQASLHLHLAFPLSGLLVEQMNSWAKTNGSSKQKCGTTEESTCQHLGSHNPLFALTAYERWVFRQVSRELCPLWDTQSFSSSIWTFIMTPFHFSISKCSEFHTESFGVYLQKQGGGGEEKENLNL